MSLGRDFPTHALDSWEGLVALASQSHIRCSMMPQRRHPAAFVEEIPRCEGPKLHRFKHYNARIEWLEKLGQDESAHGFVFRAKIKGRDYAVKVFKFHDPRNQDEFWRPLLGGHTSVDLVACYTDPFYAECRAYGRINQAPKRERDKLDEIVVKSHGFLFLHERDQKVLDDRGVDLELDDIDNAWQRAMPGGRRPRAIVKDIASSQHGVNEASAKSLLTGLARLNNCGIYNMDVHLDNFRDGKLVDFGSSWTQPHAFLDALESQHPPTAASFREMDRAKFDHMIEDEDIPDPQGMLTRHPMRLRIERRKA